MRVVRRWLHNRVFYGVMAVAVFTSLEAALDLNFKSQKGQDEWVVKEVFNYKKNGFFVDLAATNGIEMSNTFVLEKALGWKGICIEPNPLYFKDLVRNRKSINLRVCVDYTNHDVEFRYDNMALGGIVSEDTDNNYLYRASELELAKKNAAILRFKTKTLEQILDECHAPHVIDYLSLDTEGSETRILRNFPFYRYVFLCLTVERPTPELNDLLFKNGYVFVKNDRFDSFYVHFSLPNIDEIKKEPFEQIPPKNW